MLPQIERFSKWLRRRSPDATTHVHYASDLRLFFAWSGKPPGAVTVPDIDAYIEYCLRLLIEILYFSLCEIGDSPLGMYMCLEENLIGVVVADTRHQALIHQRSLYHCSCTQQRLSECREIKGRIQRVFPQVLFRDEPMNIVDHSHPAKQPQAYE